MTADALFVGIDGGGSQTRAVVVDVSGQVRGEGHAASANYRAVGLERAVQHILAATNAAVQVAHGSLPVQAAWLGLAGIDYAADQEILMPRLGDLAGTLRLTNDAELLLSALDGASGVVLIAGTGAIALGRGAQGATVRASGWGHILGDEGSGYVLGRLALQAVTRAADGRGPATSLLPQILAQWGLRDPSALIAHVHHHPQKATIARLSTLVFAASRDSDPVARRIIRRGATELALAAATVANALTWPTPAVPLALGGGLLLHETEYRDLTLHILRRRLTLGQVVTVAQPALAAARAALTLNRGVASPLTA